MWLVDVVVRRYIYIDLFIILIPTTLVCVLFGSSISTFCSLFISFSFFFLLRQNIHM